MCGVSDTLQRGGFVMKKALMTLLLGVSFVLAACGSEEATEPANDRAGNDTVVSEGEELYQKSCMGCHGGNLEGKIGPALDTVGAKMSAEEIETIILEGAPGMPGKIREGEEATQIAEWLAAQK